MPLENSSVPEVRTLMTGLGFGESPRWRDGRLWVSDWVAQEVIAVNLEGNERSHRSRSLDSIVLRLATGWTPDYHERPADPAPRTRRLAGDACRSDLSLQTRLERDRRGRSRQRLRQRRRLRPDGRRRVRPWNIAVVTAEVPPGRWWMALPFPTVWR